MSLHCVDSMNFPSEINFSNSDRETKWYSFPLVSPGRGSRLVSAVSRAQRDFIRETEKPNVFGCLSNNILRRVDFPEPDGPEMTIGRAANDLQHIYVSIGCTLHLERRVITKF